MANQAWQITSPGTLTLSDLGPVPKPGPKQALVRMHAVALNYRDILVMEHDPSYPVKTNANLIPGSDGAGVVEEAGEDSRWKNGDRVIVHPNSWKTGIDNRDYRLDRTLGGGDLDGTFQRRMLLNDDQLFRAPQGLSLEEASTIYTAGVTAYRALFYSGRRVGPGTVVLTQGTGGVSCFAIQIAAAAGATVVATSSSDEKLEMAKELGATHLINYRVNANWASEVLRVTNGKGVDITVDVVGAESLGQTLKSTAFGGIACLVGVLGEEGNHPVDIAADVLFGAKTITGQLGAGSREVAEELVALMERHRLRPSIAGQFAFEEATDALHALKTLNGVGKIVMQC